MRRVVDFLGTAEKFIEDLILVLLSVFVIILSVSALLVLSTTPSANNNQLLSLISHLSFINRAQYFVALIVPWVLMIIGLLLARELWMIRRTLQSMHLENVLKRILDSEKNQTAKKSTKKRK